MNLYKLSVKQKKILSYIHLNALASLDSIAKACNTKPHIVRFELEKLTKAKIITTPSVVVNHASLGLLKYHVYLSANSIDSNKRNELISYLKSHPDINWLCDFSGEYDFGITVIGRGVVDFEKKLNRILIDCRGLIKNKVVLLLVRWCYFGKKYIFNDQSFLLPIKTDIDVPLVKVDNVDNSLLKILSENAYASLEDISNELDIPKSTVHNRIKTLKEKKIIAGYISWISYSKIHVHAFRVFIDFGGLSEDERERLYQYSANHPNIVSIIFTVGNWDMELGIDLEDKYEIHSIISQIHELILSKTFSVTTLLRYDDIKWKTISPGVFE